MISSTSIRTEAFRGFCEFVTQARARRSAWHILVGSCILSLLTWLTASSIAAQSYSGYYSDEDDFDVELSGMPDFDQVRAEDEPDTSRPAREWRSILLTHEKR